MKIDTEIFIKILSYAQKNMTTYLGEHLIGLSTSCESRDFSCFTWLQFYLHHTL